MRTISTMDPRKKAPSASMPARSTARFDRSSQLMPPDHESRAPDEASHEAAPRSSLGHDFGRIAIHRPGSTADTQALQPAPQSCPLVLGGPRACPFGGACHTCPTRVQTKLAINQPGDEYEQEANRVAETVMRQPTDPNPLSTIDHSPSALSDAPLIVHEVLRSPGEPLDAKTRGLMEPRFAHDFGHVRVHTDARAAQSARAVNALAYTAGRDIVFGQSRYSPATRAGRQLMAHELAHTVQQGAGSPGIVVQRFTDFNYGLLPPGWEPGSPFSGPRRTPVQQRGPANARRQNVCNPQRNEAYYRNSPNYCLDTPSSGRFHYARHRSYREIPSGSGCPSGEHVCFRRDTGECDPGESHMDDTVPSISRTADGMCNLSWIGVCTMMHGAFDVLPAMVHEL